MTTIAAASRSSDLSILVKDSLCGQGALDSTARRFSQVPDAVQEPGLERPRRDPIAEFRLFAYTPGMGWQEKKPWLRALLERYEADAAPGENRAEACRRIVAALENGEGGSLDLSNLGLRSLPSVLPSIKTLNVSNNRLTHLTALPCELEVLDASGNDLRQLPLLTAYLRELRVADNALTHLPEQLPRTLSTIDASRNALVALPAAPDSLMYFHVEGNRGPDLRELARARLRDAAYRRTVVSMGGYLRLRYQQSLFSTPDCHARRLEDEFARAWRRRLRFV